MQTNLYTLKEYENFITANSGAVVYFSTSQCSVCKVLKPKLKELLKSNFPKMKFGYVDCEQSQDIAAQNSVFAVPTITFNFNGKEFLRKSRIINLTELAVELKRPYSLIFE